VDYPGTTIHAGLIPQTFIGLENDEIALAHIDVELYQSTIDCCQWLYPRLMRGGFLLFYDYGAVMCPGTREAVDEFFRDKPEVPLVLANSTALIFKI